MLFFILIFSNPLFGESHQLERLNFYPEVQAYARGYYQYEMLSITTPQERIMEKNIRNYKNVFYFEYAWKFPQFFLGVGGAYEIATESATNYGIASNRRYNSQDFKEPIVFMKTRLRDQKKDRGNIDLHISFSDNFGTREIGKSSANRSNGRNIFGLNLSHGFMEEDAWEFQNSLLYNFYDEGEEHDHFSDRRFSLGSYSILNYLFRGQYQVNEWAFLYAGFGIEYRTIQKIRDRTEGNREIQAGTGSVFTVGGKKPLSEWSVLEMFYEFKRFSYFVKGVENFDGVASQHSIGVQYIYGF